jgi:hypothetical protein
MRGKIIAVFTVVVLVVGGLSYALSRATLADLSTPGDASRALAAASAKLQLDGLVLERWLAAVALDPKSRDPFNAGTANARAESATELCNRVRDAAGSAPELGGMSPALVVLVDKNGVVLGRNGSGLMRGDDLGALYPPMKAAFAKGLTGSDVWVNRVRNEQLLASYAPIRANDGKVLGGLAVGTPFNDERLTDASDRTSGRILIAGVRDGDKLDVVAKSSGASAELMSAVSATPVKEGALQPLTSGQVVDLVGLPREFTGSGRALDGYGDGRRAVLLGVARLQAPGVLGALLWPALGVTVLGLVLVVVGAYFLDAYLSRPISEIEEGLLAIMNGRTDLRFEIEHAELGGLVFRLNSLLNQLLGVQEDETDAEGRVSRAPTANAFEDALAVDERMTAMSGGDVAIARQLREEPDDVYYGRIYNEYIQAKTSLGDPVDHITKEAFIGRIMASEREVAQKHGKPVRYKVEVRGKEVVLLAVPLA